MPRGRDRIPLFFNRMKNNTSQIPTQITSICRVFETHSRVHVMFSLFQRYLVLVSEALETSGFQRMRRTMDFLP